MTGLFNIMKLINITHPINWSNINNHKPIIIQMEDEKLLDHILYLFSMEILKKENAKILFNKIENFYHKPINSIAMHISISIQYDK